MLITSAEQRTVLDYAIGSSVLGHSFRLKKRLSSNAMHTTASANGRLSNMHGLGICMRKVGMSVDWLKAPAAGGPVAQMLTSAQRTQDAIARQTISRELGTSVHRYGAVFGSKAASESVSFPPYLLDELAACLRASRWTGSERVGGRQPRQDDESRDQSMTRGCRGMTVLMMATVWLISAEAINARAAKRSKPVNVRRCCIAYARIAQIF